MWKNFFRNEEQSVSDYKIDDFKSLLRYVNFLAAHKLGYPVSLLSYLGVVDNRSLGIKRGSLANVLLNNVGDPFKDSETSLLEVKKHEREIIFMLEKFYGMPLNDARGYVTTGGTEGNFASLWWSKRYLINLFVDKLIENDNQIKLSLKEEQELEAHLAKIPLDQYQDRIEYLEKIIAAKNTIAAKRNIQQQIITPTVFFSKGHTHYSIPKISEVLKLNPRPVLPNDDGSINLDDLRKELILHVGAHPHSGVIVIANIGTTITGAVDDVPAIYKMLKEIVPANNHTIHLDGALAGFILPILKPWGNVENYFEALGVNTLAVSAHKYPGLSQPCGIILARKDFYNKAFEKSERSVEYVGNIVDVTISGSRSGLNVLMFYNALCTLGLDKGCEKLTRLVEENLEVAGYLYKKLCEVYGREKVKYPYHFNIIFPKPSKELAKKYQLMLVGENATICVLTNVTTKLIDKFIKDLRKEKEEAIMTGIDTKVDYKIQTLNEEYAKSAKDLFVKSFCDSEPITKYLHVTHEDYEPFAHEVILKAVKEGLSKVAVDRHNRVIAVAIAEDLADPFIPHVAHYSRLKPVFSLLDELSQPFIVGKKFNRGKILHIWIAAVDQAYRGLGLSTEIDMACIEGAARKGFDYAYAEFTNELSEKVTSQFKILKLCNRLAYNTFMMEDGTRPFQGVEGEAASYLATIRPGVKLESLSTTYTNTEKC